MVTVTSAIVITLIAAMIFLPPKINPESPKDQANDIGEYVYVDDWGFVHIDRKCKRLNYKGMSCDRIKRDELKSTDANFCTNCVSDEDFEQLVNKKIGA